MATNPYLERQKVAPKNAHGKRSEDRLAKSLGARLTPASGATAGAKGDMRHRGAGFNMLIESKSTIKYSLALELDWLIKINGEAVDKGAMPAVSISFVMPDGKPRRQGEWVLLRLVDYQELMEKCNGD